VPLVGPWLDVYVKIRSKVLQYLQKTTAPKVTNQDMSSNILSPPPSQGGVTKVFLSFGLIEITNESLELSTRILYGDSALASVIPCTCIEHFLMITIKRTLIMCSFYVIISQISGTQDL
jgi:hypothetical protein